MNSNSDFNSNYSSRNNINLNTISPTPSNSNNPLTSPRSSSSLNSNSNSHSQSPHSHSQSPNSHSHSNSNSHKRKQVKNACVNCQRACKKCDDQRPCSRCVKYGIEEGCINSQRKERKRKSSSANYESSDEKEKYFEASMNNLQRTPQNHQHLQANSSSSSSSLSPRPSKPLRLELKLKHPPTRLSSRHNIRPFPKELLDALQNDEDCENFSSSKDQRQKQAKYTEDNEIEGINIYNHSPTYSSSSPSPLKSFPFSPLTQILQSPFPLITISPQVTQEFRALAQICSDLHTVILSRGNSNFNSSSYSNNNNNNNNLHSAGFNTNHLYNQNAYNNFIYQQQQQQQILAKQHQNYYQLNPVNSSFHYQAINHSHSVGISRPTSPSQQFLKPSSPIYAASVNQSPHTSTPTSTTDLSLTQPAYHRDFFNRTPPDEKDDSKIA